MTDPQPLKNPRHELFAQGLAEGKSAVDAYVAAGFKRSEGNASTLKGNQRVAARVAYLQGRAAERAVVTVEKTLSEFAAIGFANLGDYLTFDDGRVTLKASSDLTAAQLAAIQEVQEVVNAQGVRSVRFKLHGKTPALEAIGKYLGMFTDKSAARTQADVEAVLDAVQPHCEPKAYAEFVRALRVACDLDNAGATSRSASNAPH